MLILEKVREIVKQRRKALTILIACFCFGLAMQGIGWILVKNAQANVLRVELSVSENLKQLEELDGRFRVAKKIHRAEYLKSFETASLKKALNSAQEKLESAKFVHNPDKKTRLASAALELVSRIPVEVKERSEYLELLDSSRKGFVNRVVDLQTAITAHKKLVEDLVSQGFFQKHFQPSELLSGEAESLFQSAEKMLPDVVLMLQPEEQWISGVDYLGIWNMAQNGLGVVAEADRLTKRVPAFLKENQERTNILTRDLKRTKELYHRAFAAAQYLERYVPYRCLANVNRSNNLLAGLELRIEEAVHRNDMTRQDFQGAADILSAVGSQIAETDRVFVSAIDRWRDVQDAIATLDSHRKAADNAIDKAAEEIEDYDYNNQSEAENLLRDARVDFREGGNLRGNDPLRSRASYVSAKSKADLAYNNVDTSSRHSTDISNSDSNGVGDSGFFGSGGSGSSGGGGPAGGGFGGPSGGDFGGPSGGNFGKGDF